MPLVLEKRRFPRVEFSLAALLDCREGNYPARLENISLSGALVTLDAVDAPPLSRGERCTLALYRGAGGQALRLATRVVHVGSDMACLRFVSEDQNARLMLRSMIAHQMPARPSVPPRSSSCQG